MKLLLAFLFAALGLLAQNRSAVVNVSSDPAGACSPANRPADPLEYNIVNGNLWGCKAHVWTLVTGTGGSGTVTSVATGCGASGGTITTTGTITGIGVCVTIANESGTGTTTNKLVKLTGAPSTAIITATTDTTGIIGVCDSGCGKTGSALIQQAGLHITTVDGGGSVAGDWAIQSTTTIGDTADSGIASTSAPPVGALGIYLQTLGGFSTVVTDLVNNQALSGGGNAVGGTLGDSFVITDESTSSTTFTSLSTADSVPFVLSATTNLVAIFTSNCYLSTGSTNSIFWEIQLDSVGQVDGVVAVTNDNFDYVCTIGVKMPSVASGSHTVRMQYKTGAGTAHWLARNLVVMSTP